MNAYETLRPHTGAAIKAGHAYHDIPGVAGNVHRAGTADRVQQIIETVDVEGACVLDLGCAVGGISIGLAQRGAVNVVGVDWDETAVNFGNDMAAQLDANVSLIHGDLAQTETWQTVWDRGPYDVVVWLANWMWIANAAGVEFAKDRLRDIAATGATLVFETAERAGSMAGNFGINSPADVIDLLNETGFTTTVTLGAAADGWHQRSMFAAWGQREVV